jgi:hypothetical protein
MGTQFAGGRARFTSLVRSHLARNLDDDSAVRSPEVVRHVGRWSTPFMMAILAGAIHDFQGAGRPKHNHRQYIQ